MKLIGSSLVIFTTGFGIANIHRAWEIPQVYDALLIGGLIGVGFLTYGLYADIVTSQHNKED